MHQAIRRVAAAIGSIALFTFTPAQAGEPNIGLVAAAGSGSTAAQFIDVRNKLLDTGFFSSVTIWDASTTGSTPTLGDLTQFDAVLVWSNTTFQNADNLGNVLADYVDNGGGVVVAVFATSTTTVGRSLGGRFRAGGYEIIPTQSGNTGGTASLGAILVPDHPTVAGVTQLLGGTTASRPTTTSLTSHGVKIAEWSDGKTLIAVSTQFPNRVDLGLYPPSRDAVSTSWVPTTDGARILANALLYAAAGSGNPPCDPDITADGNVDQDDVACLAQIVAGDASCSSADPDFNRDGNVDQDDIDALSQVVAGAECP
jgi:hypothetical protein